MTFTATPAFTRTACRDCGTLIEVGQQITSAADGFRHGSCVARAIQPRHELELAQAG